MPVWSESANIMMQKVQQLKQILEYLQVMVESRERMSVGKEWVEELEK